MNEIFEQDNIFEKLSPSQNINEINTHDIDMREINWKTASKVIIKNHYSHAAPASLINLGFYIKGELSTVIMYSIGANFRAAASVMEGAEQRDMCELVRLFSYDWAPKNIESYCIGQSFKWIKENTEVQFLLSYADFNQDHVGIIYQATNWLYTGLGALGQKQILIGGKPMHKKSIYETVGNNKRKDVQEYFYDQGKSYEEISVKAKARYIYILGNKREKRERMKKLKLHVFNGYPKNYEDALRMEQESKEGSE